jgi:Tfp pilus assembly PilM family ATPase
MSKDKEISATEKLLEMIRGDEESSPTVPSLSGSPAGSAIDNTSEDITEKLSLESASPKKTADAEDDDFDSIPITKGIAEQTSQRPAASTPVQNLARPSISQAAGSVGKPAEIIGKNLLKKPLSTLKFSPKERIGVDIRSGCINFAKLNMQTPQIKLSNYLAVPFAVAAPGEEDTADLIGHPELADILSFNLSKFCRNIKNPEIWCSFQSDLIQVYNIIIPKVPPGEIANAVFWSTRKEVEFNPAEYIYDYSVIKEFEANNLKKIMTLVYLFPRKKVDWLKGAFKKIGYPLTGITHASSAINNLIHHKILETGESPCVHLHFEKLKSYIDVYFQGAMLFTREIKTGVNSYAESIFDLAAGEDLILDDQSAIDLAFDKTKDVITRPNGAADRQTGELHGLLNLHDMPATGRLVRQLNRTFDFCSNHFAVPRATKLYNSGPLTLKKEILREIQTEIDIDCSVIDIFTINDQSDSNMAALTQSMPESIYPLTAFGLAASSNAITPNILFTFADKKNLIQENRVNRFISLLTIFLTIAIGATFFFLYQSVDTKKQSLNNLTSELNRKYQADPRTRDNSFALLATKKIIDTITETTERAKRFTIIALVKEVTNRVPEHIQLTDLEINMGQAGKTAKKKDKNGADQKPTMSLAGFVSGQETDQDFRLLNFQKDLHQISFIDKADIFSRKNIGTKSGNLLYFTMKIDLKKELL